MMTACRAVLRRGVVLLLCAAVGGCAAGPTFQSPGRPGPVTSRPAPTAPQAPADESPRSADANGGSADVGEDLRLGRAAPAEAPASLALLAQSRSERAAGSYAAAASSIERALRIDPNNAALWVELGEIKLADDDPEQAQMMARKALTLAGGNPGIAARAERLIDLAAACARGVC